MIPIPELQTSLKALNAAMIDKGYSYPTVTFSVTSTDAYIILMFRDGPDDDLRTKMFYFDGDCLEAIQQAQAYVASLPNQQQRSIIRLNRTIAQAIELAEALPDDTAEVTLALRDALTTVNGLALPKPQPEL